LRATAASPSFGFQGSQIRAAWGGWCVPQQATAGLSGSVETATTLSSGYRSTYRGINGINPCIALHVNAPTASPALFGNACQRPKDLRPKVEYRQPLAEGNGTLAPTVRINLSYYSFASVFTGALATRWAETNLAR